MSCRRLFWAVCSVFVISAAGADAQNRITRAEYIAKYREYALENQETHGIPASITMAQALLESDCGNSRLAVLANNHFGIKCKSDWTGETIRHDDDELQECFRKYPSAEASFRDHCDFLDKSPRYAALFELDPLDYKGWAHGLKKAGYATNPKYAELLIKMIEDYELYALDKMEPGRGDLAQLDDREDIFDIIEVAEDDKTDKIDVDNYVVTVASAGQYAMYANNGSTFVVAKDGDTYKSLSSSLNISERKLRRYNDAGRVDEPAAGAPVYVKAKSNKALNGKLIHTALEGETMHSVSQAYGIKLGKLLKLNRRSADMPLRAGMQIRLM